VRSFWEFSGMRTAGMSHKWTGRGARQKSNNYGPEEIRQDRKGKGGRNLKTEGKRKRDEVGGDTGKKRVRT